MVRIAWSNSTYYAGTVGCWSSSSLLPDGLNRRGSEMSAVTTWACLSLDAYLLLLQSDQGSTRGFTSNTGRVVLAITFLAVFLDRSGFQPLHCATPRTMTSHSLAVAVSTIAETVLPEAQITSLCHLPFARNGL